MCRWGGGPWRVDRRRRAWPAITLLAAEEGTPAWHCRAALGSIAAYTGPGKRVSTTDFLLNVIPGTVVDAFTKGKVLQVLLFAAMFGFALHKFGGRGTLVFGFIEKLSQVLFVVVAYSRRRCSTPPRRTCRSARSAEPRCLRAAGCRILAAPRHGVRHIHPQLHGDRK